MDDFTPQMRSRMSRMLQVLKSNPGITVTQAGYDLGWTKGQAMRVLQNLKNSGQYRTPDKTKDQLAELVSAGHAIDDAGQIMGMSWGRTSQLWQEIISDLGWQARA